MHPGMAHELPKGGANCDLQEAQVSATQDLSSSSGRRGCSGRVDSQSGRLGRSGCVDGQAEQGAARLPSLTEAERRHRRPSPDAQVMEGVDIDENGNARLVQFVARIFDDPLLTEEQAAKMLGLSPLTLKKWRRTSRGPRYYRLGQLSATTGRTSRPMRWPPPENPQKLGHNEKGGR